MFMMLYVYVSQLDGTEFPFVFQVFDTIFAILITSIQYE